MDHILDDLPELEGRLLLYVAGELSAEQAEMVQRELAESPAAREALEGIRGLLEETAAGLATLEAAERVSIRSVRRASDRAVRAVFGWVVGESQARVLRASDRSSLSDGVVWRYARWPLAAAAVLVVGLMVWTFGTEPTGDSIADTDALRGSESISAIRGANEQTGTSQNPALPVSRLEQVAALFDSPEGTPVELGSALSEELVALRLLYEPDWE